MIRHHDMLGRGECVITITDKETGQVIMKARGFLTNYEMRTETSPIHMFGQFGVVDHVQSAFTDLTLRCKISNWDDEVEKETPRTGELKVEKVDLFCAHEWKFYQGFMDSYDYCEKCNEKKNHTTEPRFANTYAPDSWRRK